MNAKVFILLALLVVVLLIIFYVNSRKNKAKDIAVKYLESAYTEQMIPGKVTYILLADPGLYYVSFTVRNNPELSFDVLVRHDFTLGNCPDNYLFKYFEFQFVKEIQNIIDDLGKEEITARTIFLNQPLGGFKVPEALEENMPYEEMEPYIDYELWFKVNKIWTDTDKDAEACMMLELISSIQASGYSPEQIGFCYETVNKEEYRFFKFSEWDNINNVSQIYDVLD